MTLPPEVLALLPNYPARAVKKLRELRGCSLMDSKRLIEEYEKEKRLTDMQERIAELEDSVRELWSRQ